MKNILINALLLIIPLVSTCQMNYQDSILESKVLDIRFDCYDDLNSTYIFKKYSNGNQSCVFYNLNEKDSVVQYYYSGEIASIGLYFGCKQDTTWTKSYSHTDKKNKLINPITNSTQTADTTHIAQVSYSITYYPKYIITRYDRNGDLIEKVWSGNTREIDFENITRKKYIKP